MPSATTLAIFVTILVNLLILLLTLRRYWQTRIRGLLFLAGMNISVSLFELVNLGLDLNPQRFQGLQEVAYLLPVLMGVFFTLFLDSFSEESLVTAKTVVSAFFLGAMGALVLFAQSAGGEVFLLLIGLYFIIMTLWAYRILNTSLIYTTEIEGEKQIRQIKIGLVIAYLGTAGSYAVDVFVLANTGAEQATRGLFLYFIPHVMLTAGTVFIALSVIARPRVAIVNPQQIYQLFVILDSGLPLFSYKFSGGQGIDETLISGALNAITNLMKEAAGVEENLDSVRFGDRTLIVGVRGRVFAILIADRVSRFLREGLDNFLQTFETQYHEEIETWTGNPEDFTGARQLIQRAFGLRVERTAERFELEMI